MQGVLDDFRTFRGLGLFPRLHHILLVDFIRVHGPGIFLTIHLSRQRGCFVHESVVLFLHIRVGQRIYVDFIKLFLYLRGQFPLQLFQLVVFEVTLSSERVHFFFLFGQVVNLCIHDVHRLLVIGHHFLHIIDAPQQVLQVCCLEDDGPVAGLTVFLYFPNPGAVG